MPTPAIALPPSAYLLGYRPGLILTLDQNAALSGTLTPTHAAATGFDWGPHSSPESRRELALAVLSAAVGPAGGCSRCDSTGESRGRRCGHCEGGSLVTAQMADRFAGEALESAPAVLRVPLVDVLGWVRRSTPLLQRRDAGVRGQ